MNYGLLEGIFGKKKQPQSWKEGQQFLDFGIRE